MKRRRKIHEFVYRSADNDFLHETDVLVHEARKRFPKSYQTEQVAARMKELGWTYSSLEGVVERMIQNIAFAIVTDSGTRDDPEEVAKAIERAAFVYGRVELLVMDTVTAPIAYAVAISGDNPGGAPVRKDLADEMRDVAQGWINRLLPKKSGRPGDADAVARDCLKRSEKNRKLGCKAYFQAAVEETAREIAGPEGDPSTKEATVRSAVDRYRRKMRAKKAKRHED